MRSFCHPGGFRMNRPGFRRNLPHGIRLPNDIKGQIIACCRRHETDVRPLPPFGLLAESVGNEAVSCRSVPKLDERQLPHVTNECCVPIAAVRYFEKRTFRNVEVTGAARLYRAASSDRR
jgi:hypothetical protein